MLNNNGEEYKQWHDNKPLPSPDNANIVLEIFFLDASRFRKQDILNILLLRYPAFLCVRDKGLIIQLDFPNRSLLGPEK